MANPRVIVLSGYGLNCEEESLFAFKTIGIEGQIIHINDLIEGSYKLKDYQILFIPGGFSYGDDTGSGRAYANRLKLNLNDDIREFALSDKLILGVCNGCQILAASGLLGPDIILEYNDSNKFECRWVNLKIEKNIESPWLKGIETLHIPVAHGEGKFILKEGDENLKIAARYIKEDGSSAKGEYPFNPNGAMFDTAALTDKSGKILAIMPHPERALMFTQRDDYPLLKEQFLRQNKEFPIYGDGVKIFKNASEYFK